MKSGASTIDNLAAFKAARTKKAGAVLVLFSPVFYSSPWRARLAQAALAARLPTIFQDPDNVEAGGLISYGTAASDTWGRAAYFVDRVLKGPKPQDLPVEQPVELSSALTLYEREGRLIATERGLLSLDGRDPKQVLAKESEAFRSRRLAFEKILALVSARVRENLGQ